MAVEAAKKELREERAKNEALALDLEKAKAEGSKKASEETQQELLNLRRENKLITSAWYDLTCRLQSNTVVLQRRSEAPKSWLAHQRAVVGGAGSSSRR